MMLNKPIGLSYFLKLLVWFEGCNSFKLFVEESEKALRNVACVDHQKG